MKLKTFVQEETDTAVFGEVKKIGDALFEYCNSPNSKERFSIANLPGNSSSKVQDVFLVEDYG